MDKVISWSHGLRPKPGLRNKGVLLVGAAWQ